MIGLQPNCGGCGNQFRLQGCQSSIPHSPPRHHLALVLRCVESPQPIIAMRRRDYDEGDHRILDSALVSSNTSMDEEDHVVVVQQPPTEIARQLKEAIREGGGGGEDDDNSRDFVLTPSHVQAFLALFPLLQSLACENWHDITDRHLQAIAEMQLSLQELSFIEHDWLDCRLIGQIACQSASTLQYLRCGYLDGHSVGQMN
eukprot:gene1125-1229_t